MLFILIAFSAGWHRGVANRYWNVTGQPKGQIQESFNFPTLVQKNAGAGSFSNLCVYSFYSLKPCCPPLEANAPPPWRNGLFVIRYPASRPRVLPLPYVYSF